MAVPRPNANELRFAYQLIRYLGGNVSSWYLILAVVAWVRRESGTTYIGNNPLNIRNSRFAVRYRYTSTNGRFAVFSSLQAAAKASAEFLKQGYYRDVVAAIRRSATTDAKKQEQARDFLYAIALSPWSSTHYGYGRNPDRSKMTVDDLYGKNKIIPIWAALLKFKGLQMPKDAEPKPPKPPPLPERQKTYDPSIGHGDWLEPYADFRWYEDRFQPMPVVQDISFMERGRENEGVVG